MGNSYVRQAERPITVQLPPGMIVVQHRKPFYTRLWFIGLALVLAYVFAPQPVKDRLTGAVQHAQVTAASRGVDPLNIRTYSNLMAKDAPAGAAATTAAPMTITPDMHSVIEDAQMRAQSMAAQPGGQSMEAIEKENLRLQEMARDLSKDAHLE
jgi:hypothetical protein